MKVHTKKCPQCGRGNAEGDWHCDCGHEFQESASGPPSERGDPSWSAKCRYQHAYVVARRTITVGRIVKVIGIVLGLLIARVVVKLGSQSDRIAQSFLVGLLTGAVVAVPIYVLGVLVSAVGQILKATLDTAVHGSPFLKKEDMARVMCL